MIYIDLRHQMESIHIFKDRKCSSVQRQRIALLLTVQYTINN